MGGILHAEVSSRRFPHALALSTSMLKNSVEQSLMLDTLLAITAPRATSDELSTLLALIVLSKISAQQNRDRTFGANGVNIMTKRASGISMSRYLSVLAAL